MPDVNVDIMATLYPTVLYTDSFIHLIYWVSLIDLTQVLALYVGDGYGLINT